MVTWSHLGPRMAQDIMVGACSRDFHPKHQECRKELKNSEPNIVFAYFLLLWLNTWQRQLREGRVCFGLQLKLQFIMVRRARGRRVMCWSHCVHRQEARRDEFCYSSRSLFPIQPRIPAHEIELLLFRAGLPSQRQTQGFPSWWFQAPSN